MLKKITLLVTLPILMMSHNIVLAASEDSHSAAIPTWLVIPFVLLLLMIATGPLFYEHFWHKHYVKISVALALLVMGFYVLVLGDTKSPIHAIVEYVPFISFLAALFISSGGISIEIDKKSSPIANTLLLLVGSIIANIIGTTGASMLLIRPFINMNRERIRPYHIIFFIFIVSNTGGALTPIGDPPLFLGFLKGVPFLWSTTHNFLPWCFAIVSLLVVFFIIDKKNSTYKLEVADEFDSHSGKIKLTGNRNFIWLALTVGAIFLDPNIINWIPAIDYHGAKISFVKEIIWLGIAFGSYKLANNQALKLNNFNFEPIREVAFLFIGIFGTMTPAIQLISEFASSSKDLIGLNFLYWGTGGLSGFLDNAPTYLNFLTAGMASQGFQIGNPTDVVEFSQHHGLMLEAVSISAVFFGAMTYIGNGPNFMVKSIAENVGIDMPTFFSYLIKYSIPILLPILFVNWYLFFHLFDR